VLGEHFAYRQRGPHSVSSVGPSTHAVSAAV